MAGFFYDTQTTAFGWQRVVDQISKKKVHQRPGVNRMLCAVFCRNQYQI